MRLRNNLLVFLLVLAGCSTAPPAVPYEALADCEKPPVDTRTNGGLAKGIHDLRLAIDLCNKDKAILRDWAEGKD